MFDMLEYCDMLGKYNIDIIYSGPIWAGGIESLGDTLRRRLEFDEMSFSTSQAVFSVFVEQMNNVLMYSEDKVRFGFSDGRSLDTSKGTFVLGLQDKTYFIQCGNVIKSSKVEALKDKIDYINTLDKNTLRKFYREQIKSKNENVESKGGGLGLIEIARRTSSQIKYDFVPLEDGLSFYTLYTTVEQGAS